MLITTLIRAGSILLALATLSAVTAGWVALNVLDAALTITPTLSTAASPSEDLLASVDDTLTELRTTLEVVASITDSVAASTSDVVVVVEEVADLSTGQIPAALSSLEASLPALIDTADVIDSTMRTLSIFGVQYEPAMPLDDAFREVQTQLEGLPETIAEQGVRLEALVSEIEQTGIETGTLSSRVLAIEENLMDAQSTIADYRVAIGGLTGLAGTESRISTAIPIARVSLVVLALSGLALAGIGWAIGGRLRPDAGA